MSELGRRPTGGEAARRRDERPPRRYAELAAWFHLLTHPDDYADEAASILDALSAALGAVPDSLLELGSGGGNNAVHLAARIPSLTLVDISPDMQSVSRGLVPAAEHVVGDMRSVRLGRTFDAVLVHDAACYLVEEDELRALGATLVEHLRPGGAALVCPDHVAETFAPETRHGGHDAKDGRGLRYVSWVWDPDPHDHRYTVAMATLMRHEDDSVTSSHDVHEYGLFPRDVWRDVLERAGLRVKVLHDDWDRDVFLGVKPTR